MAIIVDPLTHIVTIEKINGEAGMTLIQSAPNEIWELNINAFRLACKDWEDSVEGIIHPKTNNHNTEILLGGITFARAVDFLAPYTFVFEDGQYAVRFTGGNTNLADRTNVNQVSVRPNNSAGLISSPDIEFASFNGAVTIDVVNGVTGTLFPRGTRRLPVNNIADALLIDSVRGLNTFSIIGDIPLTTGDNISNYIIIGESQLHTTVTIDSGADVEGCIFKNCTIDGILDGNNILEETRVSGINYLNGYIKYSLIRPSVIRLGGGSDAHFLDCWTEINGDLPEIDMGGSGQDLNLSGYKGGIKISNLTDANNKAIINLDSGEVIIDSSVTAGTITIRGVGVYSHTQTGTEVVNIDALINQDSISKAVWDEPIGNHLIADTMGHEMYHTAYGGVVHINEATGTPGTDFPIGTKHTPALLNDGIAIAQSHNFLTLHIEGFCEIDGQDLTGFTVAADRSLGNTLILTSMINTDACYFQDLTVSGNLAGKTRFTTCVLGALTGFDGGAKNSLITNDIEFTGDGANYLTECDVYIVNANTPKVMNLNGKLLNIIRCRGSYLLTNKTDANVTAVDLVAGDITIDSSCISGFIGVSGTFKVTDNSGPGCEIIEVALTSPETIWGYDRDA